MGKGGGLEVRQTKQELLAKAFQNEEEVGVVGMQTLKAIHIKLLGQEGGMNRLSFRNTYFITTLLFRPVTPDSCLVSCSQV